MIVVGDLCRTEGEREGHVGLSGGALPILSHSK